MTESLYEKNISDQNILQLNVKISTLFNKVNKITQLLSCEDSLFMFFVRKLSVQAIFKHYPFE